MATLSVRRGGAGRANHSIKQLHLPARQEREAVSCGGLVLVIPLSVAAHLALKTRRNHAVVADSSAHGHALGRPDSLRATSTGPVCLTFTNLFGRSCFSFGSTRFNEIVLPSATGIEACHFQIRFEMQTTLLLLVDTSESGTQILDSSSANPRLLRQGAWPLLQSTTVSFGRDQLLRFRIELMEDWRETEAFRTLFMRYAESVRGLAPISIKAMSSVKDPRVLFEGRYMSLHAVGGGRYERVYTCLRLADGRLFAVKIAPRPLLPPRSDGRGDGSEVGLTEAGLLSQLRHPNVVSFVDQCSSGSDLCVCMGFVPSGSLAEKLAGGNAGCLSLQDAMMIARQSLRALAYLHGRRISHGSIRTESILIESHQPTRIRLCNFGRSKRDADDLALEADLQDLALVLLSMAPYLRGAGRATLTAPASEGSALDMLAPWNSLIVSLQSTGVDTPPSAARCLQSHWSSIGGRGKHGRPPGSEMERPDRARKCPRKEEARVVAGPSPWQSVVWVPTWFRLGNISRLFG